MEGIKMELEQGKWYICKCNLAPKDVKCIFRHENYDRFGKSVGDKKYFIDENKEIVKPNSLHHCKFEESGASVKELDEDLKAEILALEV